MAFSEGHFWSYEGVSVPAADKTGEGLLVERHALVRSRSQQGDGPGDGRRIVRRPARLRQPISGPDRPREPVSAGGSPQPGVDLAGGRLSWRGLGRAAWSLLSDLAGGELADDMEVADVVGVLLDQLGQDRSSAEEGEAAFELRPCRRHSSPYPHLAEARETGTGKDILAPL
jgi:hypothetical protein